MRLFEHLQSYAVVAAAVARVSAAVESAKASDNSLVKLTVSTAETYVVPTVQRAVVHVADRYPLAIDYLDNYSCLALETTETTLANASQRLDAAKQSIAAAPATAIHRAFELTELLVDHVLPPLDDSKDDTAANDVKQLDAQALLSSSLAATSSITIEQRHCDRAASHTQRAQALAQVISDRLRQRVEQLPRPVDLVDFARSRHHQLDAAVASLDAFSLRARQSLAAARSSLTDRLQPHLHVEDRLAAARHLLCSASDAAQQLLTAARSAQPLHAARAKLFHRFASARNGVVAALDAAAAHLPAALRPYFARFHHLVAYLLTVPDLPADDKPAPADDFIPLLPSTPPLAAAREPVIQENVDGAVHQNPPAGDNAEEDLSASDTGEEDPSAGHSTEEDLPAGQPPVELHFDDDLSDEE